MLPGSAYGIGVQTAHLRFGLRDNRVAVAAKLTTDHHRARSILAEQPPHASAITASWANGEFGHITARIAFGSRPRAGGRT